MENKYTLIACIGRGGPDVKTDKGDYKKTNYYLNQESLGEFFLFPEALVNRYKESIDKVILIGTETSHWYALIPDYDRENAEMFLEYYDIAVKKQSITDVQLKQLQDLLSASYKKEVVLLKHNASLNEENLESVLSIYSSIYPYINKNTKLMIDISHGLRFMPLFIYQSLQFYSNDYEDSDVKIYYGEMGEDKSYVRDISYAWKMAEINKAVYSFTNHYDGKALAKFLSHYDKDISNWILRFTHIIDSNLTMQIKPLLENLKVKIIEKKDIKIKTSYPQWVKDIAKEINNIFDRIYDCSYDKMLFNFSNDLWIHGRKAQAIITLNCAVETKLIILFYGEDKIGDYRIISEIKNPEHRRYPLDMPSEFIRILFSSQDSLRVIRNLLAHAGGEDFNHLPSIDFEKARFEDYKKATKWLLEQER